MRTILTLDDDVAARLEQLRHRGSWSQAELVNEALRRGLSGIEDDMARSPGHHTLVVSLGRPTIGTVDDVSEALSAAEGDLHR